MASTKQTTAADLAAAVKLGTIDPSTAVITVAAADAAARKAVKLAQAEAASIVATAPVTAPMGAPLSATAHECGIVGCKHGTAHGAAAQPDRQVKLQCPSCGAVARMTASALRKCGGINCNTCSAAALTPVVFAEAARRTYRRAA